MTVRKTRSQLYRAARLLGDVSAARRPQTVARRMKNRLIGEALGRASVWRRLWR